ncbi:hypothetical protein, conserved [Leishmania shawi]|uniref:Uncharacterized protein n=1 Tax=Leishmania shawi TaxID=5680 RepID=A0ABR3EFB0_9TRYP
MSENVAHLLNGRPQCASGNAGSLTRHTLATDSIEEVDIVSATTRASSPEATLEQQRHVALPQKHRGLLQCASWHRRRPRSGSVPEFSLPPQQRLACAHSGRKQASEDGVFGEDTQSTGVSLSSLTVEDGNSGSSRAASADDDEERRAELSWNPRTRAHPLNSALHHDVSAKWRQCIGHRLGSATEGRRPAVSLRPPPLRTPRACARPHTHDIPATLANLLRHYLSWAPPLSPVAAATGVPSPTDGNVCTRFLSVRWGCQAMTALQSQSDLHRRPLAEERTWDAAPPCPPRPPRRAPSPSFQRRLSASHTTNRHGADEHRCCSATSCHASHRWQQLRQQEHLWNLLTHYPRDASACLSLGLGVCAALDAMRAAPPPVLPVAVLQDIAATTATEISAFVHACEEAWQTAVSASPEPTAALPSLARSMGDATCMCGCLAAGQLLDPALYRFHLLYYRHHHRYTPLRQHDGADYRAGESSMNSTQHSGERYALEEARAAVFGRPHAQRQPPQQARCLPLPPHDEWRAPGTGPVRAPLLSATPPPPHLPRVQGTSPTALLPLLAVQTLSGFVQASSARRSSVMSRQRRRWGLRATRRGCGRQSASPPGATSTGAPPQPAPSGTQSSSRGFTTQQSQPGKSRDDDAEANPLCNYAHFCDETERLWAVMASVLLAWKQLEQCVSLVLLVPRLEVLPSSASHTWRLVPPSPTSQFSKSPALSPLARAAASMRLHNAAVEGMLLHATHDSAVTAPPVPAGGTQFERAALARLRVRLLSIPPRPRHTASAEESDNVASSLCMMEAFVYGELQGQIAHLPLWCAVAVEVLQLYIEQFRQDRTLLARMAEEEQGDAAALRAAGSDDDATWACVHSSRVHQVVLLAIRLMTLPCVFANRAFAPGVAAERTEAPPPTTCQTRRWRQSSPEDRGARVSHECGGLQHPSRESQAAVAAATGASAANVEVPVPVSATTVAQLSAVMTRHPLFGVAVAVVGGGVPLHWAVTCVAPRAMNAHSHAAVPPPPFPAQCSSRSGDGVDSRRAHVADVAAADAEAQTELRRLVQLLHMWLREAERRP